jgi:hypothetical protein
MIGGMDDAGKMLIRECREWGKVRTALTRERAARAKEEA